MMKIIFIYLRSFELLMVESLQHSNSISKYGKSLKILQWSLEKCTRPKQSKVRF